MNLGLATKVVQITNIAPQATKDQMQSLFGNIGKIDEIRLYPTIRDVSVPVTSRICYVRYFDNSSVAIAQHLTNTVFIDRALIVIPVPGGIPEEYKALEMAANGTLVPGLQRVDSKLPPEVVNRIDGMVPNQVVKTDDPKLIAHGLPEYPALPVNFDARKIEETRRTILLIDIKSSWKLEELMDFFKQAGEVKYARYAENRSSRLAMIEFVEQRSVINALKMQGQEFHGIPLNVYHSTQPINKPEAKSNEAAQREIEEAMNIVKEAQNMISAAIDPVIGMLTKDKSLSSRHRTASRSRTRSRSKDRRHSRSVSRKRSIRRSVSRAKRSTSRRRTRSRSRERSTRVKRRSTSRSRRSRSRDHYKRKRSRSPRSRRSRSRSKGSSRRRDHRRASRSRSRKRSRSRDRKKSHRHKEERRRKSRSRSRESSHRQRDRVDRERSGSRGRSSRVVTKRRSRTPDKRLKKISEERVVRDYDAEEKIGLDENGRAKSKSAEKSASPDKSDGQDMDISNSP